MKLTTEQAAVRDAAAAGHDLVVEAGAGSGKTSTLNHTARAMLSTKLVNKGVYVGFNKVTADEAKAKFPSGFDCRTGHSLAFASHGRKLGHKLPDPSGSRGRKAMKMVDVAKALRLEAVLLDAESGDDAESRWVQPDTLARLALSTVEKFYRSARDEIDRRSLPRDIAPEGVVMEQFDAAVLEAARRMWADHASADGYLQMPHDAYRKLWALDRPRLFADVVMLDEAQDTPPVLARVVQDQQMQQIVVGDSCQQLYAWAGAIDALSKWDANAMRLFLTQSFRFGPAIAAEANKWLTLLGKPLRLTGWDALHSEITVLGDTARAVLCRTNVGAVGEVMAAASAGRKAALVGGGKDIKAIAYAAKDLMSGRRTEHPELCIYNTWEEVCADAERDGSPLKAFVSMINRFGPSVLIDLMNNLVTEERADVVVSTGHKAKGREWESVRICGDFALRTKGEGEDSEEVPPEPEDMMLAYVAVTRAVQELDRGPLEYIDTYSPAVSEVPSMAAVL